MPRVDDFGYVRTPQIKTDPERVIHCGDCKTYLGIDAQIFSFCPFCGIKFQPWLDFTKETPIKCESKGSSILKYFREREGNWPR